MAFRENEDFCGRSSAIQRALGRNKAAKYEELGKLRHTWEAGLIGKFDERSGIVGARP